MLLAYSVPTTTPPAILGKRRLTAWRGCPAPPLRRVRRYQAAGANERTPGGTRLREPLLPRHGAYRNPDEVSVRRTVVSSVDSRNDPPARRLDFLGNVVVVKDSERRTCRLWRVSGFIALTGSRHRPYDVQDAGSRRHKWLCALRGVDMGGDHSSAKARLICSRSSAERRHSTAATFSFSSSLRRTPTSATVTAGCPWTHAMASCAIPIGRGARRSP